MKKMREGDTLIIEPHTSPIEVDCPIRLHCITEGTYQDLLQESQLTWQEKLRREWKQFMEERIGEIEDWLEGKT